MNNAIEIPGAQFERELRTAAHPVLVHFYTSWSGQGRIPAPLLEALAGELAGDLSLRTLNLDAHPELAARYRITDVPALILFDHGAPLFDTTRLHALAAVENALKEPSTTNLP